MELIERSYSGKIFRPRPEISQTENAILLTILTPWGAREPAKEASNLINEYVSVAFQDEDATSPFEKLTCLSPMGNAIRIAALLCNEVIYRTVNEKEFRTGLELFIGGFANRQFVWVQIGNPHVVLLRKGCTPMPLSSQPDLAFEMSDGQEILPPLPGNLLGVNQHVNLSIGSIRPLPEDRLLLLSRSHLPSLLFRMDLADMDLHQITQIIASENPEIPFWLGLVTL